MADSSSPKRIQTSKEELQGIESVSAATAATVPAKYPVQVTATASTAAEAQLA